MPVAVTCQRVSQRYDAHEVLRDVCWHVPAGTCVALVGRSGAGKTTLLRLLAGLEPPKCGSIYFAYAPQATAGVFDAEAATPARSPRRGQWPRVGMVFQSLGLWPHLTARQHLAYVLHGPRRGRSARIERLLREVSLSEQLWDRLPAALSGGEAQRLALARALASEPQILLLDEPLAQLDAPLRTELMEVVRQVVERRGVTCVYVTHHGQEALEIAARIAVLEQGALVQEGPVEAVYWHPVSAEVARLTGSVVELPKQLWLGAAPTLSAEGVVDGGQVWLVRPQQLDLIEAEPGCLPAGQPHAQASEAVLRVAWCRPHGCGWQIALSGVVGLRLWSRRHWQPGAAVRLCLISRVSGPENMYHISSRHPRAQQWDAAEPPG